MREFERLLQERREEINAHLSFIGRLEAAAVGRGEGLRVALVDSEPINILKSGFLIHLYNVVEAVMSKLLEEIEVAARVHAPRTWCEGLVKEWAKGRVNLQRDLTINNAENRVFDLLQEMADRNPVASVRIPRKSGNWSHEEIEGLAAAITCSLVVDPATRSAACEEAFEDQMPPMKYIRHKRNRLAHGNESFLEGARHLTTERLEELKEPILRYMVDIVSGFDQYLDNEEFLAPVHP